jgi:hypothetical protein
VFYAESKMELVSKIIPTIQAGIMREKYNNVAILMRTLGPEETKNVLTAFNKDRNVTYADNSASSNILFLLRMVPEDKLEGFIDSAQLRAFGLAPE